MNPIVSVMMGSDSDLPVMGKCAELLESFDIPFEITIISAHRTPDRFLEYVTSARERGIKVIIAGAGGAAHLPGMAAAITPLPVIGVPIYTKTLSGVDSLYSIVQMPPGIPVATVGINAAENAGLLAAKILAVENEGVMSKLIEYAGSLKDKVVSKAEKLETVGYKEYMRIQNL